jgi:hypothetical protein
VVCSLTSSTIWPAFISTVRNFLVFCDSAMSAFSGNGQSTMGRNRPTLRPFLLSLRIAVRAVLLAALLGILNLGVLGLQLLVVFFEHALHEIEAAYYPGLAALGPIQDVVLGVLLDFDLLRVDDRLHHLPHNTIRQDNRDHAPLLGQVEGENHQLDPLLDRVRREHDIAIVAVASALGRLEVVGLRWSYVAEAGAPALHVYDDGGQFIAGEIGYAFLLEAHARRGG